ncbi:MAG: hypothetical protein HFE84_06010 [Lachnospiraceae bacterium]|nr:hypothetical protein [Lachnospiraceae bacterium]
MKQTTNYNLNKPEVNDLFSLEDWNQNSEIIDAALAPEFEDYTGDAAVPDAAAALAEIKSNTKLGTLFQNIKAFCKGCCTLGMLVNNCVTDNADLPLAASQGKFLLDSVNSLNSDLAAKLGYVRMLTSADDLDDLFTNGVYYYPTSSVPQNAPFQNAAIVEVFGSLSPSVQKIQRVTRYGVSGQTAFRPRSDTRWEAWTHGGNSYSLDAAVQIPEGADLNDYVTPGNYLCNSTEIAKTLKNCPFTSAGFVLHVERVTGGSTENFIKQKIVGNSSTSEEYWRNKVSTAWKPWRENIFKADLNWQYATWTRLAGAGAGTYVSTYYSPYMIFVRACFNSNMQSLTHHAWYQDNTYFYPFAQINQNLWNLTPASAPTAASTQYLGHIMILSSREALGAPQGTAYGAIWVWWDGTATNIGLLRQSAALTDWECNSFTVMSKPVMKS